MQPNGNMPGAGQPVGPAKPVNPVNPVNPTRPVRPVTPTTPATSASEPTFDNGPSVVDSKGGKKTGWILAVVLLLIVAIGGVGFGVWAMMDGNTQKEQLNSQISTLKKQNSELSEQITLLNEQIDTMNKNSSENNVIETGDGDVSLTTEVTDGFLYIKDNNDNVLVSDSTIGVTEIVSCDYLAESNSLRCSVMVSDNDGWILYDVANNVLTSSFDKN